VQTELKTQPKKQDKLISTSNSRIDIFLSYIEFILLYQINMSKKCFLLIINDKIIKNKPKLR